VPSINRISLLALFVLAIGLTPSAYAFKQWEYRVIKVVYGVAENQTDVVFPGTGTVFQTLAEAEASMRALTAGHGPYVDGNRLKPAGVEAADEFHVVYRYKPDDVDANPIYTSWEYGLTDLPGSQPYASEAEVDAAALDFVNSHLNTLICPAQPVTITWGAYFMLNGFGFEPTSTEQSKIGVASDANGTHCQVTQFFRVRTVTCPNPLQYLQESEPAPYCRA